MLSAALSMISDETDKELVRSLYENNEQLMYNVAYKILHNRSDAEDAVQDAFVNVINHLEKIREINCNETRFYLVIIVKNISLNKLKKKQQRHPEVDIDEVFDAQSDENVEAEALDKINSEVIREALCELSDKDYEIMFLYLIKEYTPSDIAQLLGITANLARQQIFRARQRLIKLLEKRGINNDI